MTYHFYGNPDRTYSRYAIEIALHEKHMSRMSAQIKKERMLILGQLNYVW